MSDDSRRQYGFKCCKCGEVEDASTTSAAGSLRACPKGGTCVPERPNLPDKSVQNEEPCPCGDQDSGPCDICAGYRQSNFDTSQYLNCPSPNCDCPGCRREFGSESPLRAFKAGERLIDVPPEVDSYLRSVEAERDALRAVVDAVVAWRDLVPEINRTPSEQPEWVTISDCSKAWDSMHAEIDRYVEARNG